MMKNHDIFGIIARGESGDKKQQIIQYIGWKLESKVWVYFLCQENIAISHLQIVTSLASATLNLHLFI